MKAWENGIGRVMMPILVYLGVSLGTAFLFRSFLDAAGMSGSGGEEAMITTLGAMISFPLLYRMWRRDREQIPSAVRKRRETTLWFYAAVFIGGALASWMGGMAMQRLSINDIFSNRVQEALFAGHPAVQILGLGMVIPAVEELLYRGLVYERIREFIPKTPAIVITAAVFALSHGNMIQIIYAFPMAFILHWCYEKSGSLAAPTLFHMGANLFSVCSMLGFF